MLTQSRKPVFSYLHRLKILSISFMIFSSFAFVITEKKFVPDPPDTQQVKDTTVNPLTLRNGKEVFSVADEPPTFPGDNNALYQYLSNNIRYPKTAIKNNTMGTVFVSFIVTDEGEIVDIKTIGKLHGSGLEEEAIRVIEKMPKWVPGKIDGKPVNVLFNLPIRFTMEDGNDKKPAKRMADDGTYLEVEQHPVFPGGIDALMKYLYQNVRYPKEALRQGLSGVVRVRFDIDIDGSVINAQTLQRPIGGGLEEEALRVVNSMPNWLPGKEKGEVVRVRMILPISFKSK